MVFVLVSVLSGVESWVGLGGASPLGVGGGGPVAALGAVSAGVLGVCGCVAVGLVAEVPGLAGFDGGVAASAVDGAGCYLWFPVSAFALVFGSVSALRG